MKRTVVACVLALFTSFSVSGQGELSTKSKKAAELFYQADNFRVRGQFDEAIDLLNQAIDKDDKFVEAYYLLGRTYHMMLQYPKAIENYEKGLSLVSDLRRQKMFWYDMGEAYLLAGQYEKAMKVTSAFVNNESGNKAKVAKATTWFRNAEFAIKNKDNALDVKPHPLSDTVNQFENQYFPALTADQQLLIFTRRIGNVPNENEDLVVSSKDEHGRWTTPQSISKNINTRLNEGTCTISADGRKLIFTSCAGRDNVGSCDLYESRKIGNEWTEPKNLGRNVNSNEWESHPSLSADGRTLYFVSDRRSGFGRDDIWISTTDEKGEWTKAVNAGKQINSQFSEMSPFIHANNKTLFFATNGLPGFGGFDLYFAEKDSTGWTTPKNLGAPINDNKDQFSLFITADGKKGYYSYEETMKSGHSKSKIYEMLIPEENQIKYRSNYVKGIIRDKDDKQPLNAKIELINLEKNVVESLVESDSVTGEYLMVLTQGAEYALYVNKEAYLFKSYNFNYSEITDFEPIVIDINLEKTKEGSTAVLNNIFFDVDRYDLKKKSVTELQKMIRFLSLNPNVRVEIGGHTDNSGSADYNRQLSERRANAVFTFLSQNGIDKRRLITKGYGPDRPIASNDTEEGRSRNRRIEVRIIR